MAISKRLRFEILRRDNYACRYCGAMAPEAKITVDHVAPIALGGGDEPENLCAACVDCNGGKSSMPADVETVADVAQDAMRWRRAMEAAAGVMDKEYEEKMAVTDAWVAHWNTWGVRKRVTHEDKSWAMEVVPFDLPGDWRLKVFDLFRAGLPLNGLCEAVDITMGQRSVQDLFAYFIGVARQKLHVRQQIAREMIDRGMV